MRFTARCEFTRELDYYRDEHVEAVVSAEMVWTGDEISVTDLRCDLVGGFQSDEEAEQANDTLCGHFYDAMCLKCLRAPREHGDLCAACTPPVEHLLRKLRALVPVERHDSDALRRDIDAALNRAEGES